VGEIWISSAALSASYVKLPVITGYWNWKTWSGIFITLGQSKLDAWIRKTSEILPSDLIRRQLETGVF
jgi:hypothetical protein